MEFKIKNNFFCHYNSLILELRLFDMMVFCSVALSSLLSFFLSVDVSFVVFDVGKRVEKRFSRGLKYYAHNTKYICITPSSTYADVLNTRYNNKKKPETEIKITTSQQKKMKKKLGTNDRV